MGADEGKKTMSTEDKNQHGKKRKGETIQEKQNKSAQSSREFPINTLLARGILERTVLYLAYK